ncbi:hypothetical protein VZC37_14985 [Gordonia sp. LSe1-13]|uniref:Secreted protein n=1 Tax=Gordonia sesuvii TaxID=3116777 RepID=A0ABU7MF43_9ACTN|nr:hypothetical protein [Gordonia sp. LSe1-13]
MGRRSVAVALTATAVAVGVSTGVAAPAQAAVRTQPVGQNCWGLSPHVVDIPLYGGATVRTDPRRPGSFSIWGAGKSFFSYTTDTWVTVLHFPTGHIETFHRRWQPSLADLPGFRIDDLRASGPIRVTVRSVARGPVPVPPLICSGTAVA